MIPSLQLTTALRNSKTYYNFGYLRCQYDVNISAEGGGKSIDESSNSELSVALCTLTIMYNANFNLIMESNSFLMCYAFSIVMILKLTLLFM